MIEVRNPASGALVASVAERSAEELVQLAGRARAAQPGWAALTVGERGAVLRRLGRWMLDHSEELVETICSETGKAYEDALAVEVAYTVSALSYWASHAGRHLAERRALVRSPLVAGRRLVTRHVPRGLVGVIGPWNYPLLNSFGDAIPALAAGNSVLLKPSELTPLTSLLVADAALECGLPPGVLTVVVGGAETGEALVELVDFVMFTGSTATGRRVAARAGAALIPCSLELGGKDALIVLAGAPLERAANVAAHYGTLNAGQTCISIERVYVQAQIHDEFVAKLAAKVGALRVGLPGGPGSVDVGAITSEAQLAIIEAHVADALERGARVAVGGGRVPGTERCFEPTVLVGVDHTMRCMREETFGPTLPVMAVADEDEAVALVNDSPMGLGAAVFAGDLARGEALARRLEVGAVCVDDAAINYFALDAPMGGAKQSGIGVRHGAEGIRKYCRTQTILISPRPMLRRELHFHPYRKTTTRLLRRALGALYRR